MEKSFKWEEVCKPEKVGGLAIGNIVMTSEEQVTSWEMVIEICI